MDKKIIFFALLPAIFMVFFMVPITNAQVLVSSDTCQLRAEINPEEYEAITGARAGTGITVPAGPRVLYGPNAGTNGIMCTYGLVKWASNIFFVIVFTVATLFIALAGFLYITAGANPQRANRARSFITYAVIGLIVAGLARVIPAISQGLIGI